MIRVLLAEDMHMVRGALAALLNLENDIEVVAEVAEGDKILGMAKETKPDVAIIDIDLPGKDGLTAAAELGRHVPCCHILVLTSLGRPATVRRALNARVNGFLLKDAPSNKLANAVRSVAIGQRVIDGELALSAWEAEECPLTPREVEILRLAANGSQVSDIAAKLFLSTGTVRNYLANVVTKLNARNRVDAIRIANDSEWL
ncbi:response regulator transcription factor [Amycolatopsis suaedae]|uniref:Response regulator transcription factor n=1 Tax=Amycolatopsis suaedae TaxID=2510978 RepID=A0A4Q7J177_9PSEU|nr:response regulator transcription factor [Amycolatopsis suaedae]RZQ61140.1 response regulator transcription factor [Amycolatopsis suaedae]